MKKETKARGVVLGRMAGVCLLIMGPASIRGQEPAPAVVVEAALTEEDTADAPELWFPVGEKISYKIYWGMVPVAYSEATTEWVHHEGRRMLAIRFRTRSNKVIRKIYPVDDHLETIVDPQTFLPVRFTKQLNEGRYHTDEVTVFDHQAGRAHWRKRNKDEGKTYDIDPDTRDLISFMYSMRTAEFPVGTSQTFQVMADEKLYELHVKALKEEAVKLDLYGEVDSIKLKPTAKFEGLFVRKGDMEVWVSADPRRIITRATAKIPVASIWLVLDEVTGPGEDFWVNPPEEEEKATVRRRRRN